MGRFYFITNEDGQGLIEYGLILGLVAAAVLVVLAFLGPQVADLYNIDTNTSIKNK